MAEPSAVPEAVFDLIRAHADVLSGVVAFHDGQAPDGQDPPWIQGSADPGFRESTARRQTSDYIDVTVTTICVGNSSRASRRISDIAHQALLHVTPTADGWTFQPIRRGPGRETVEDNDLAGLWHTTPTWRVRAYEQETP